MEAEESREGLSQAADHRSRDIRPEGLIGVGFVAERASEDHAGEEHRSKSEHARDDITPKDSSAQERIERRQQRGRQKGQQRRVMRKQPAGRLQALRQAAGDFLREVREAGPARGAPRGGVAAARRLDVPPGAAGGGVLAHPRPDRGPAAPRPRRGAAAAAHASGGGVASPERSQLSQRARARLRPRSRRRRALLRRAAAIAAHQPLRIEFADGEIAATADGRAGEPHARRASGRGRKDEQGSLF